MNAPAQFLNPSEAARRLGISAKALRLYEQRGLVAPARTAAGWRAYGPEEMARGAEIAALRALGLSLAQVARVLNGDAKDLEPALAAHQAGLEVRMRDLGATVARVRDLRVGLARGIILCPANHSPPSRVAPYPGTPGYEAVATCLASPDVRARTEGVIALRPQVA